MVRISSSFPLAESLISLSPSDISNVVDEFTLGELSVKFCGEGYADPLKVSYISTLSPKIEGL